MKKVLTGIMLGMFSFSVTAQKQIMTFEAKIENRNGDKIYILGPKKYKKEFGLNKSGIFKDTLKVSEGMYRLSDGVEQTSLFLKPGMDLKLKMNAKEFDESIVYSGKGAKENNFLAQEALYDENYNYPDLLKADEKQFEQMSLTKKDEDLKRLKAAKLDAAFVALHSKNIETSIAELKHFYQEEKTLQKLNNAPSPSFNYENHKGGTTKLEDLRGKYVYVDVWATWCGPCRAEIPYLKAIEEKYHDKKIEFVSISIDTKKDYEKWKKFVTEKQLGGIQLFADNDWNSAFVKAYNINGIPRFILIDPKGNIVNSNVDRPSSPKLVEILDKLLN
ncbi:TlpA disulfide reductase family protein [Flavobacterium sp.]|uniref:TlpA family protein disulfide reductase n=1 Tax=Flavobacterium sp. TaxID=239 RepID=UPI002625CE67|nr:TlpA disulfide reductase family protein [Flavobacterium sp.]MDD3003375.1 TlpA disulfide reductase family protein [Flavobacterium sp.]